MQDEAAVKSQNLAENAQKQGYFDKEIVKVIVPGRKVTDNVEIVKDEYLKHGTSLESLSKLRPCFIKDGTVTAGNASGKKKYFHIRKRHLNLIYICALGINDSAAAVLLASGSEVKKHNLKTLAKIVAFSQTGCEPAVMGAGIFFKETKSMFLTYFLKHLLRPYFGSSRSFEESWMVSR